MIMLKSKITFREHNSVEYLEEKLSLNTWGSKEFIHQVFEKKNLFKKGCKKLNFASAET